MITPVTVEEVRETQHYAAKSTLRPDEKRREIARLAAMITAAQKAPPHKAAGMLAGIWIARQSLDWGCRPVVSR